MKETPLYKRVYFHAVRRAMLENETIMKGFMDTVAVKYSEEKLETLDSLLVEIDDNDLFNLIMGYDFHNEIAEKLNNTAYSDLLKEIAGFARKF